MNLETEVLFRRIEDLERQTRAWKLLVAVAIVLAAVAIGTPYLGLGPRAPASSGGGAARFSTIEANRILLRDTEGAVAGGLEVGRDQTVRLVLGGQYGTRGAAFLEVQGNGAVGLTLRGPDSGIRAALLGTSAPSLTLSPEGTETSVAQVSASASGGQLRLAETGGRVRFRAP
jgi:hypothetical protein